jgi:hypothetical protein
MAGRDGVNSDWKPGIDSAPVILNFSHVPDPKNKLHEPTAEYTSDVGRVSQARPLEIDFSQLEHNLSLTPEERLVEHQCALELVLELEAAGKKLRDEPQ